MEFHDSLVDPAIDEASLPFVGRWTHLVSTTNWEKGRIIHQWRQTLVDAGRPTAEYSDEAWAALVVGVSGQHVGRLRRTYERFGELHASYDGLYWSHFQAALDWSDAEMWLEGALQNGWSVSQMRQQRHETLDAAGGAVLVEDQIVACEFDEDGPEHDLRQAPRDAADLDRTAPGDPRPQHEARPAGGESRRDHDEPFESTAAGQHESGSDRVRADATAQPLGELPPLPNDLQDAFDAFKLAIVRHRLAGWQEAAPRDVLTALDALCRLVTAPTEP